MQRLTAGVFHFLRLMEVAPKLFQYKTYLSHTCQLDRQFAAHLGGYEDVLALDDAFGYLLLHRLPHLTLVLVEIGGVYMPVADVNCM